MICENSEFEQFRKDCPPERIEYVASEALEAIRAYKIPGRKRRPWCFVEACHCTPVPPRESFSSHAEWFFAFFRSAVLLGQTAFEELLKKNKFSEVDFPWVDRPLLDSIEAIDGVGWAEGKVTHPLIPNPVVVSTVSIGYGEWELPGAQPYRETWHVSDGRKSGTWVLWAFAPQATRRRRRKLIVPLAAVQSEVLDLQSASFHLLASRCEWLRDHCHRGPFHFYGASDVIDSEAMAFLLDVAWSRQGLAEIGTPQYLERAVNAYFDSSAPARTTTQSGSDNLEVAS